MSRKLLNAILSILAYTVLYTFTAIIVLITILLVTLNLKKILNAVLRFWAKTIFFGLGKRIRITRMENLRDSKKSIIISNHGSLFDIPAVMSHFPDIAWLGKEYLIKIPIFGKALKMTGYIPVRTSGVKNTKEALQQLIEKSGIKSVAIFPEGTRTENGELLRFYKGFIRVMQASQMDIVPITLNGFFQLKPKTTWIIDFNSKLEIVIHKRIEFKSLENKDDEEIINIVKETIASAYKQNKIEKL